MTQNTDAASPQVNNQNVHPVFGPILDSIAPKVRKSVERFDPVHIDDFGHKGYGQVKRDDMEGDYVQFADYEALERSNAELLEALEELLTVSAKGAYYPHEEVWLEEVTQKSKAAIAKAKGGNLG